MRILVVGGGGREHALVWKIAQSAKVTKIFCAPGNPGIGKIAKCVEISAEDIKGICDFAKEEKIDLAVIGSEVPLAMGIVDALLLAGIKAFGPNKKCARLEASKAYTKEFLLRHKIPTAKYLEFTDVKKLLGSVGVFGFPMVLKADGLAAGKGVIIAQTDEEARVAILDMMENRAFGDAGDKVVVEEFLRGTEASVLCFVDENTIIPMESAQDYKRIFDTDKGPNTGGMGTYSPSLLFDESLEKRINDEILIPTLMGFQMDGLDFKGVLFIGIMLTDKGPKVIEFNNRFGDPETQSLLARLDSDILEIMEALIDNRLSEIAINWKDDKAVCVVLAAAGYPGDYAKGDIISGFEKIDNDVLIFHAGTKYGETKGADGNTETVSNGGRVLGITALGKTHEEARKKAYENVKKISFKGMQYRSDIGLINK